MKGRNRGKDNESSVQAKGKSVEKALKKALKKIDANINEVDVEVEDPGEKGILGIFGARDARVRVVKKEKNAGVEELAEEIADIIMTCLEVNYRIFSDVLDDSTYINIETAGVDGLLIGRKGDTLNSLQHLVGRIVSKRMGGYRRLTLDVGGYLKNRYDLIRKKAKKAAERARSTQKDVGLEPMKSAERRVAHITLADKDDITTYTVGSGELRKVFVAPVQKGRNKKRSNRRS